MVTADEKLHEKLGGLDFVKLLPELKAFGH